jgi:hypothetical protein
MLRILTGDCIDMLKKLGALTFILWATATVAAPNERAIWDEGYDYVKLREEQNVANTHPAKVSPARVRSLLNSLRVKSEEGQIVALLSPAETERLAKPIAEALSRATSKEDVIFFTSDQREEGLFASRLGTTGRIFATDQTLNIIVGTVHKKFVNEFRATRLMPSFSFGSRTERANIDLGADGARYLGAQNRRDWLGWKVIGEADPIDYGTAPAAPAPPRASAEERLRKLKQLSEQRLITEQEYKEKRAEILKEL